VFILKLKLNILSLFWQKKVRQRNLCTNILRSIKVQDLPSLGQYPKSHQVTFLYYQGRLLFLEAAYQQVIFIFIIKITKLQKLVIKIILLLLLMNRLKKNL
jgi:hypothetical protein